jgi:hypothetical protein
VKVVVFQCPWGSAGRDGDAALPQPVLQFRKRNVALGGHGKKDQFGVRLDRVRVAVTALALGRHIAIAPLHGPPPDRARPTDAKSLSRRSTRQSALNRVNDTSTKVNGKGSGHAHQPPRRQKA